jgi:hypothetical protein
MFVYQRVMNFDQRSGKKGHNLGKNPPKTIQKSRNIHPKPGIQ